MPDVSTIADFRRHLATWLPGPLTEVAVATIRPDLVPVRLLACRQADRTILVTEGMSARPLVTPSGGEEFRFAELRLDLPPDWPLNAVDDDRFTWPLDWLKRLSQYPHRLNH